MKKFLLKSLLFLVPFLLFLMAVECWVRLLPNTYKYKESWMQTNGQNVSTLVLGNSHAYYDLIPAEMGDSVFNLSNVSQRIEHDFFLLKRYAAGCPNLKRVVMVVDNSNLFDCTMEEDEPGRLTYYQLYMGYDKHSRFSRYAFELSSMISFKAKMGKWLKGEGLDCNSLGWGRNYTLERRTADALNPIHVKPHQVKKWEDAQWNAQNVDSIAMWCKQHDVQLVILATPVCAEYNRRMDAAQRKFLQQLYLRCQQQYQVEVLDYSADQRFLDNDFFDPDHLSSQGARKFSRFLQNDLNHNN